MEQRGAAQTIRVVGVGPFGTEEFKLGGSK